MPSKSPKELLAEIVAFDTTSSKTNLPLINYVSDYLEQYKVNSELLMNREGNKASLFATIGPGDVPGIGLSAHTDVVPVEGQKWNSDPFTLTEKDGRYYGRGACDMKGFLSCVLASVPELVSRELTTPVHIIFSYDEEVGCTGVRPLISELGARFMRPRAVIVGEPTSMQVVDAHKSIDVFATEITGHEAHSSATHLGVNAIMIAAEYIAELAKVGSSLEGQPGGERFSPPYSTVHVGRIEGGTALNIVPKTCRFFWETRTVPGAGSSQVTAHMADFTERELLPRMKAVCEEADIRTERLHDVPAYSGTRNSEAITLALSLAGQNETHAVSYGTEAGLFELGNCPTVVCGPGNIEQAHKPDEFVEIEQIEKCMKFLNALAGHLSA